MRGSIAIGLLLLFSLLPAASIFAADPDSSLPACCRRDGKHHCMANMSHEEPSGATQMKAVGMKCPMYPAFTVPSQHIQLYSPVAQSFYAGLVRHPAIHVQTETHARICWSRSQQKRGPPVVVS